MKNRKNVYCEIAKFEKQDDGTLIVSGYASTAQEDSDGEIITPEAMKAALPDYMKFGAVREMHQASAAGTAVEAEVNDQGQTEFTAHVVDPTAVLKVETKVYKGFSIGGKVTKRNDENKKIIEGLNLVEVSLVDRPANPGAVFTMYKAEGLEAENAIEELADLLDNSAITPQKLLELAKAATAEPKSETDPPAGETPPAGVSKAAGADDLKKGMWGVSDFAGLLQSIAWIASDAQWEAEYEGDNSPIPGQLRAWLKQGAEILHAMTAEETAELIASLNTQAGVTEEIAMSAKSGELLKAFKADDVAKAGKKFSADTAAALGDVHKAMKECCDKMAALGYDQSGDADGDDKQKGATTDDLKKVSGELDVAKADLAKVSTERDNLAKRVKELEAKPEPGKALLKAISKGDDLGSGRDAKKVDPVTDHSGQQNEVASLIKAQHAQGGFRLS